MRTQVSGSSRQSNKVFHLFARTELKWRGQKEAHQIQSNGKAATHAHSREHSKPAKHSIWLQEASHLKLHKEKARAEWPHSTRHGPQSRPCHLAVAQEPRAAKLNTPTGQVSRRATEAAIHYVTELVCALSSSCPAPSGRSAAVSSCVRQRVFPTSSPSWDEAFLLLCTRSLAGQFMGRRSPRAVVVVATCCRCDWIRPSH